MTGTADGLHYVSLKQQVSCWTARGPGLDMCFYYNVKAQCRTLQFTQGCDMAPNRAGMGFALN